MDWVQGELNKEQAAQQTVQPEPQPRGMLAQWYEGFPSRLERDVNEFNHNRGGAAQISVTQQEAVVENSVAGVKGTFLADIDLQQIRSDYAALREGVAVPEGEIFTLRNERGRLAIFSADQEISEDALRQELLKPVLFPEDAS